jgi:hypothetical protein
MKVYVMPSLGTLLMYNKSMLPEINVPVGDEEFPLARLRTEFLFAKSSCPAITQL